MSNGPEWFEPQRYGLGTGLPITWQGWAIVAAYTVLILASVFLLGDKPLPLLSIVIPATVLLTVVCARTTRGGWRWRWGDPD